MPTFRVVIQYKVQGSADATKLIQFDFQADNLPRAEIIADKVGKAYINTAQIPEHHSLEYLLEQAV